MSTITIETTVTVPVERAWETWTRPEHIIGWAHAGNDWHCPRAENEVRQGGRFLTRMESVDGKVGFDFTGTYTEVVPLSLIAYTMDDKRTATVAFERLNGNETKVVETFETEMENSEERQREGWQSILNNYKKYTETNTTSI